ncbi:origin recognition complex subunit 1-like isoform X1 [Lates japonicus]|uniref:Origin recognition complex subunit 1-like isoform X1 n=1 Tax=Lates japonicus TaxID=270547 RepID=A0AAD3NAY2_LATJO|nr:origin recognition complex subunit 1-like isoform X1 [Lates japonicus]
MNPAQIILSVSLLGREPHPQEIFYYQGRSYDDEVNAESILRPVQVRHLDVAAPFPDSDDKRHSCEAVLDLGTSGGNLCRAPASHGPSCRALPTPDPAILRKASSGEVRYSRATMSSGKVATTAAATEAESLHSATKLSATKCLCAKRRNARRLSPQRAEP